MSKKKLFSEPPLVDYELPEVDPEPLVVDPEPLVVDPEPPVTIVIPFKSNGNDDELRIALRSIEKNAKFDYRIVIIGDTPKFLNPGSLEVLNPKIIPAAVNPKAFNLIEKMRFATESNFIDDEILMTYDDIVFLNPVEKADISEPVALGMIPENQNHPWTGSPAWVNVMHNTIAALKRNNMSTYNGETHLPRLFDKEKLAQLFAKFGFKKRAYMLPTLYLNEYHTEVRCLDHDPKNTKSGIYKDGDLDKGIPDDTLFLNWGENQWNYRLRSILFKVFPEKSRFEI